MKGEGGFGMRISVEGVVTAYSAPGGAAEVRGCWKIFMRAPLHDARWRPTRTD